LQIALIVCVLFAIAAGVSWFLALNWYKEAEKRDKTHLAEATKAQADLKESQDENGELKRLLGIAATQKIDAVQQQFKKDMETYARAFPADKQYYRPVLELLNTELNNKNAQLVDAKKENDNWKQKYEGREATKDAQIKEHQDAVAKASADLKNANDTFKADRDRLAKDQADTAAQLAQLRKATETIVQQADTKTKEAVNVAGTWQGRYKETKTKLDQVTKDNPDVAAGEIKYVNSGSGTVYIDRGRGDGLRRQATFSVYAGETTDLSKTGKKGSIEVIQVAGEHLAEARITEDRISDPLLPGDKIYTPVWRPGEQRHFALTGVMDVEGDGRDNRQLVRDLITMNGGVIDAEMDDHDKPVGAMTATTRYLVVGGPPDPHVNPDGMKNYSNMITEAKKLDVEQISLAELLNRMGWKSPAQVIRFGVGGNSGKIPKTEGAQGAPGSNGTFKPRNPPASGNGSSYYRF
jgi:hypothetical protein